jgi:hypothetical protein
MLHWTKQIYKSCNYSSLIYNNWSLQCCTCNLKHVYWNKVNKLKSTSLLLHQLITQPATVLVATMWIVWTPSDAVCHHIHTLPSLPDMLHITFVVIHITHFAKAIWLYSPQILYIGKKGAWFLQMCRCDKLWYHFIIRGSVMAYVAFFLVTVHSFQFIQNTRIKQKVQSCPTLPYTVFM